MSRSKSFKLAVGNVSMLGVNHGWPDSVGRRNESKEKLGTSTSGSHEQESPTADWVRAVAMIAEMNKQAELESKRQLLHCSARDFELGIVEIDVLGGKQRP